jgi:hypothetical protein
VRVLMMGERPEGAAPSLTLARHLARLGCEPIFASDHSELSSPGWIRLLRGVDAVIVQMYGSPPLSLMRRAAVALALGKTVVRRWAGSDVLACQEIDEARRRSLSLERLGLLNITPASWLAESLARLGIKATVIPQIVDSDFRILPPPPGEVPASVLVYLPGNRRDFYGERFVREAVERNPDLTFLIVADDGHALAGYPNVESLGWVADMSALWERVGCVLRMTRHDGLPRMVLEGLARGRYAICSIPLEGCWQATSSAEVQELLGRFRRQRAAPNLAGVEAAHRMTRGEGAREALAVIQSDRRSGHRARRLNALAMAALLTFRIARERVARGRSSPAPSADVPTSL